MRQTGTFFGHSATSVTDTGNFNPRRPGMAVILLLILCLLPLGSASAQGGPRVHVFVDSAFLRAEPLPGATPVGSAFEDDWLEAVGRNADGTWFQVRRPGRSEAGSWISAGVIDWEFDAWAVPMTSTAGADGPEPVIDSGLWVFVLGNLALRAGPDVQAAQVGVVPHSVTIPVTARNRDATWIRVNYNGHTGWITAAYVIASGDLLTAPAAEGLPPQSFVVEIIPPELQLAQVERLRAYLMPLRDQAESLATFWEYVLRGEVMPCGPLPFQPTYARTPDDIRQLPELQRYLNRLDRGTDALNTSLEILQPCGVYERASVIEARANAINARLLFSAVLRDVEYVVQIIR